MQELGALPYVAEKDARADGLYVVPVHYWQDAQAAFAKLAKRARNKLGADAPQLVAISQGLYEHRWTVDNGDREIVKSRLLPAYFARIDGPRPKLAGWELAARSQLLETNERFLRVVPGMETLPKRFRALNSDCDHCQKDRRRGDVFVVRHAEQDKWMQVGKTCLKDFLGHDPARLLLAYTLTETLAEEFEKSFDGGGWQRPVYPAVDLLEYTCAVIRVEGWRSRKTEETSGIRGTASAVGSCLSKVYSELAAKDRKTFAPTAQDEALALDVLAWVRRQEPDNDYMSNLVASLKHDVVDGRTFGVACSAVSAYMRAMNPEAELNMLKRDGRESKYVGELKQRLRNVPVTVVHLQAIESQFGPSMLTKAVDGNGNVFTWFGRGADVKQGFEYLMTGTVKEHAEYKGKKQTMVSRCVFEPMVPGAVIKAKKAGKPANREV